MRLRLGELVPDTDRRLVLRREAEVHLQATPTGTRDPKKASSRPA